MVHPGTAIHPLRVAIIGSGPAAFYAAEHLFKQSDLVVSVDMFDRMPTPFGLVRSGVAPDHQKIKTVVRAFEKIAAHDHFRFFGGVEFGKHLTLDDVRRHYHMVVYATGAQSDRRMGIPGEDLLRSHPATEFVAWYNGHPDYRNLHFDLSQERVAVVGVGNVAIDVARILCRTPEELATTDIADYAYDALCNSKVKEVYLLGRRGAAQAAFTNPEVKEVGELEGADVVVLPEEVELDPLSRAAIADDRAAQKKVELLQGYAHRELTGKPRRLHIRFLVSPVELVGGEDGGVIGMRLARNELVDGGDGSIKARATGDVEDLGVGLVFRSVGYRGVALEGVPFHDRWGVIHNAKGRVVDGETNASIVAQYTAGWIKRGPSGVIGTNKPCSVETVNCMLEDLAEGKTLEPDDPSLESVERVIRERQPDFVCYADWKQLDEIETALGKDAGRPRVKFTAVDEMLRALGRVGRC